MLRLIRLLCPLVLLLLAHAAVAGDPSIAIYGGTEKITSTGGGNTPSNPGTATGKRRQSVFIAIDVDTGDVQRVIVKPRGKTYVVEAAVRLDQVFAESGGRRSREFVRLMLVSRISPQPGEFTNTVIRYDGRTIESTTDTAGLTRAFPRVLTWDFQVQYSGFAVAPPGITFFPQIDSGRATLSLNRSLTSTAAGGTLADAINVIKGALAQRGFSEEM